MENTIEEKAETHEQKISPTILNMYVLKAIAAIYPDLNLDRPEAAEVIQKTAAIFEEFAREELLEDQFDYTYDKNNPHGHSGHAE